MKLAIAAGVSWLRVLSARRGDRAEEVDDRSASGVCSRMLLGVGKKHRVLRQQVGVEVARGIGVVADQALDQIGLAGALLELARVGQHLLGRGRQDRLAALHQPGLLEQLGVDVEQAAMGVERQAVELPPIVTALRLASVKRGGDARLGQIGLDRLEQALRRHSRRSRRCAW
jgi:hypothetical protein